MGEKTFLGGNLTVKSGSFGEPDDYLFRSQTSAYVKCRIEHTAVEYQEDTKALSFVKKNSKPKDTAALQRIWDRRPEAKRETLRVSEFAEKYARREYAQWQAEYEWSTTHKRWLRRRVQ